MSVMERGYLCFSWGWHGPEYKSSPFIFPKYALLSDAYHDFLMLSSLKVLSIDLNLRRPVDASFFIGMCLVNGQRAAATQRRQTPLFRQGNHIIYIP
jgi:hypothetical protein